MNKEHIKITVYLYQNVRADMR